MTVFTTHNIFEASFLLTDPENVLKEAALDAHGSVKYTLLCTDEAVRMKDEFSGGLAHVNLLCYLLQFKSLYQKSLRLQKDEAFLTQGGVL